MIVFKNIKWKNFISYGNHWTEVNLNQNKSSLIIGENGSGKSSILDALSYGLYGKPFRKVTTNQLINSINDRQNRTIGFGKEANHYVWNYRLDEN